MRQGDNGDEVRMSVHDSRVEALARVLIMESGVVHKQTYWVSGPPGPALRDDHDLRSHLLRLARQARSDRASWTLSGYLRGLWKVGVPLRGRTGLELDDVAAMFSAAMLSVAAAAPPPPYAPGRSVADLGPADRAPAGYSGWERVIQSQIADLEDFALHPPSPGGPGGIDAPRPPGGGTRATPARWAGLDPAGYLERAATGRHGPGGAHRPPPPFTTTASPPAPSPASPPARPPAPPPAPASSAPPPAMESPAIRLTWDDLADIAINGQAPGRPEPASDPRPRGHPAR